VRVTVSHTKSREQIVRAVDRSFDDLFRGIGIIPLQIANEQRSWQGPTLIFSFTAKLGLLSTPIKGTVEVTDHDVTIDADLGLLERLIPAKQAETSIERRVRGLLR
jgi:hypothetical protein